MPLLATDRQTLARLRGLSLHLAHGVRPGLAVFAAPERHAGRGEPAGLTQRGRMRHLHFTLSALRGRLVFRRKENSPRRIYHLVVDLRFLGDGPAGNRLLTSAGFLAGVLLTMSDTEVHLGFFGSLRWLSPTRFTGPDDWRPAVQLLETAQRAQARPTTGLGPIRQATMLEEPAHLVLLTHHLEPEWVRALTPTLGATLVLVAPPTGQAVGFLDPGLSLQPTFAVALRLAHRYDAVKTVARHLHYPVLELPATGHPLDALEAAILGT